MKAKTASKHSPRTFAYKSSPKEAKIFMDWASGKRKRLPRSWDSTNVVRTPSRSWLMAVRKRFKLTAHEFGGLVGMQASDVKDWETGKQRPGPSTSRLLGLLAQKPYLVKFMQRSWPDDPDTRILGSRAYGAK